MATVSYAYSQDIPVLAEVDVAVVGGGPGGLGAAVMAARAGAKTLLVERYAGLGGMAFMGEVHPFMGNHVDGEPLDAPVYTDWMAKMQAYWPQNHNGWLISKDAAALAAEELCLDAGVQLLYHHTLFDAIRDGRRIDALVFHSKSGLGAVKAKVFVDCTGDADVAARAGCAFEMGGPSGHCQPMTTCFKLCGCEPERIPDHDVVQERYTAARERGDVVNPRENILRFPWFEGDVVHFNTTRVIHKKATDGVELSQAEIEARGQIRQLIAFLRKEIPGFENARLHSMAHHIGVRESRRVKGIRYLTRETFTKREKFDDAIARVRYMIDIHNPDGAGTEHEHMEEGEWYEIPYGCVVAADADNLTVGGRPISVDHAIHSSMRVMPPAISVGQGAGLGAALAAARNTTPASIDGGEVRKKLVEMGARLGQEAHA